MDGTNPVHNEVEIKVGLTEVGGMQTVAVERA